jgi:PmbA protein
MNEIASIEEIAREQKVGQWDIYIEKAQEYEIQLRNFQVEVMRGPIENFGYAIRVIKPKGKKVGIGIGTGNIVESSNIRKCLETALIGAETTEFPGYKPSLNRKYQTVKVADPKIESDAESIVKDKAEQVISLLKDSESVVPTFGKIRTYVISTNVRSGAGVEAEKKETLFYLELALKAERNGKLAEFWPMYFVRRASDARLEERIPNWTKLAKDALDAKPPKTMKTSVIFTPTILSNLLPGTVGFHCLGSSVLNEVSKFKKGQQVCSDKLSIYDDGVCDYALGSSPFDDEGTPQSKTMLVENGVHKNFLYDSVYAGALNDESTGNGQKLPPYALAFTRIDVKYQSLPAVQPTNVIVDPGSQRIDELIETTKEGIYLEQLSSASSDSLTTSFGSEIRNAYLIKDGELSTPLKGGQISGFLLDSETPQRKKVPGMLSRISGLTRETEMAGRCIVPYIRFEDVQVSGL